MDISFFIMFSIVNISCIYAGYVFLTRICDDESNEMKKYRKMTDLEIKLLNKKIEEMYGKHSVS